MGKARSHTLTQGRESQLGMDVLSEGEEGRRAWGRDLGTCGTLGEVEGRTVLYLGS